MADITAQMVKELRDRTGVGMAQCKTALVKADGDMEEAISILRKAGIASAVKKEGREAKEGMIGFAETKKHAIAIVEVNAETDFVAKNNDFLHFVNEIAHEIVASKPSSMEAFLHQKYSKDGHMTIDQYRSTIVQKIGENIQVKRMQLFQKHADTSLGVYSHMNGKIVAVVELKGSANEDELARNIAMHVAAARPDYISQETIPSEIIEKEKEVARAQMEGKRPDNILEKIIQGKLAAFYSQTCLLNQKYIRDEDLSIEQLLQKESKEKGVQLSVSNFVCWSVGE